MPGRSFSLRASALGLILLGAASCGGSSSNDGGGTHPGQDGGTSSDGAVAVRDASAGPPPPMTSAVTIIVEPDGANAQELVNAINNATTSVHMTMYLLSTGSPIMAALINAHAKGLDVKVLLNSDFAPNTGSNSTSYAKLMAAGVPVQNSVPALNIVHEKAVIIDAKTAWIMTMNATDTAPRDNREYLAIDTDPADVAEVDAMFNADYGNKSYTPSGNLVVSPVNSRSKLVALIDSAGSTIDLEVEELYDSAIVAALNAAADRGVKVRAAVAEQNGQLVSNTAMAIPMLKAHNIAPVEVTTPYLHAKAIVVDGVAAYVGSENFGTGSLSYNRECGVLFNAASEVAKISSTMNTDFAGGKAL
jgi:phosphatidylserine/phosphatidylglycerophosphate/cardiolipin synthase-like enzyme